MKFMIIKIALIIQGLLCMAGIAQGNVPENILTWADPRLSALIEEGLSQNREIQSMVANVAAFTDEIDVAGSLDDPRIGFGALNLPTDSFSFNQEAMTQKQFFIAQKFPWFGTLDLKSKRALSMVMREKARLWDKKLGLARQIAETYYELGFVLRRLETNKRLGEMIKQHLRVLETKYAAGKGLQNDVLLAQVEYSQILDEDIMLKRMVRTFENRLNGLTNRGEYEPYQITVTLSPPDVSMDPEKLKLKALAGNSKIQIKQAEIDHANIERELAKKAYHPNLDVKLSYGQRTENAAGQDLSDFFSASVTMNIPLWQKTRQDKKLSASENKHLSKIMSYQNLARSLPHEVDTLVNEIKTTLDNYTFYKKVLLLQAKQLAQSSMAAYRVGKVDFANMIRNQIRLVRLELKADKYLFDIYGKRARLSELVGSSAKF